jgi:hypothetical protein
MKNPQAMNDCALDKLSPDEFRAVLDNLCMLTIEEENRVYQALQISLEKEHQQALDECRRIVKVGVYE